MRFANVVIITAAPTISVYPHEQIFINSEWQVNVLIKVIFFALRFNGMMGRRHCYMRHLFSLLAGKVGETLRGQKPYHLRPQVFVSCVSVVSRVVNFTFKEMYQLHP
jgi:hypothetical protein